MVACRAFGQTLEAAARQVEVQNRLGVGVHARSLIRGSNQPGDRLVDEIGARVVIGERGGELVEPIAVQRFERARRFQVKVTTNAGEQAVVGDILGQRVPEDEHRFVAARPFIQELLPAEVQQLGADVGRAAHPREEAQWDLAAEQRMPSATAAWPNPATGLDAP